LNFVKKNKTMTNYQFQPESLMMSYGYKPELSQGAIKCPIFQTSTFVFRTAEEGKAFFEIAYGIREKKELEELGLIYSRINNPDIEILENRLTLWDDAEECAVFESGMAAITTTFLEFLKPNDILLCSGPLYGGTDHFINHFLPTHGITIVEFMPFDTENEIIERIKATGKGHHLSMIYVETPANPTNTLIDLELCRRVADYFQPQRTEKIIIAVDNTYMGPLWQQPLKWGVDISLYSATKYIGGHSDVIAGAACGSKAVIGRIKVLRTFLGNMAGPFTGWLLLRSLETLKIRMEKQAQNAEKVVAFLQNHTKIERIYYLGLLTANDGEQYNIYQKQYSSAGAMISFDLKGGEKEAFAFLNKLKLIKLAVSLGSTESLVEHPASMTHIGVKPAHRQQMNITDKMVRLSVGVEHYQDLIWDIEQALVD
jgi:methionine-gamma-lyase